MSTIDIPSFELNNRNVPADIHYMFIDTETTGVPENNYSDWSQCRLIQLGMLVKNRLFETVYEICLTVKYDGTNASTLAAYNIHGISENDRMNATEGYTVCDEFINVAQRCDVLVSHGNAFDFGVIFRECLLYGFDISCLVGKVVCNTKQSEHYRGFRENLSQTVLRLNPNWSVSSGEFNNDSTHNYAHNHNALYDAHLCAELWRHSHHPSMNRPMQDLIEYLNFRRYADGLQDIRIAIENYHIANANQAEPINESINEPINESINEPINESINEPINESINEPINESINEPINESINVPTWDEEEESDSEVPVWDDTADISDSELSDITWYEEALEEEEDWYDYTEEDPAELEYAYGDAPISNDHTSTEDYLRSFVRSNLTHHAPEDGDE